MQGTTRFRAVVNMGEDGDILCFCSYDEYLRGQCDCREKYDCPEAFIEVTILPKSKPSEQGIQKLNKVIRNLDKTERAVKKANHRIKQGVNRLEESIKKIRLPKI